MGGEKAKDAQKDHRGRKGDSKNIPDTGSEVGEEVSRSIWAECDLRRRKKLSAKNLRAPRDVC